MKKYLLNRPMLLSGIFCSLVTLVGYYSKPALFAFAVIGIFILGLLIFKDLKQQYIVVTLTVLAVIVSTVFSHGKADTLSKFVGESAESSFVVRDVTYSSIDFCNADIEIIDSELLKKGTRLTLSYYSDGLKMGDTASAKLELKGINDKLFRKYHYSKSNFIAAEAESYTVLPETDKVLKLIAKTRGYIEKTLFSDMGYTSAATVTALLIGEDKYLTDRFWDFAKASGVSHIMVVSGMHLSITVLAATYFVEKLIYDRRLRAIIIMLVVVFLTAICGFTASMLRAGVTYILIAIGLLFNRNGTSVNSLGAAVSLILTVSPFTILDVGFQLSVLATLGILAVAVPVTKAATGLIKSRILLSVFSASVITLSAMLLTLPVSIISFGWISVVALVPNLLIGAVVNIIFWMAIIGLIISLFCGALAGEFFFLCEPLVIFVNKIIEYFGSLPFATVTTPPFLAVIAVGFILLVFFVLLACKKRSDMLKLEKMKEQIISEGGSRIKWR